MCEAQAELKKATIWHCTRTAIKVHSNSILHFSSYHSGSGAKFKKSAELCSYVEAVRGKESVSAWFS